MHWSVKTISMKFDKVSIETGNPFVVKQNNQCYWIFSSFLSPPNKVSEGTMKRAPYVCVCVRVSVRACVWAQNVEICFFSVISWPILILFVLSDRAWCGLQNFYTEFRNSLIMQIYANLFKINEKCYFSVISWPILILFVLSDRAWCGLQNFYTEFWNSLIMQIYSKSMKNATSPLFRNHNRSALEAGTYITHRVMYYPLVV